LSKFQDDFLNKYIPMHIYENAALYKVFKNYPNEGELVFLMDKRLGFDE